MSTLTHGFAKRKNRHPLYKVWCGIKSRCLNPNDTSFMNYGGRGITICKDWLINPVKFIQWAINNGWEKELNIDRKDINGNYCPENCRFVTKSESNINQRKRKDNTSGCRGIHYHRSLWDARIQINRKRIHIGSYKVLLEAVKARNNFIIKNRLSHILN